MVCVTERIGDAYPGEEEVAVSLGAMVEWRNVSDKPSINGVVLDGNKTTKELGIRGVAEATLVDLPEDYTPDTLRQVVNAINACLRASMASLAVAACALFAPCAAWAEEEASSRVTVREFGDMTSMNKQFKALSNLTSVVTAVDLEGLAEKSEVDTAIAAEAERANAAETNLAAQVSAVSSALDTEKTDRANADTANTDYTTAVSNELATAIAAIPAPGDGNLTITLNGKTNATFSANSAKDATANIDEADPQFEAWKGDNLSYKVQLGGDAFSAEANGLNAIAIGPSVAWGDSAVAINGNAYGPLSVAISGGAGEDRGDYWVDPSTNFWFATAISGFAIAPFSTAIGTWVGCEEDSEEAKKRREEKKPLLAFGVHDTMDNVVFDIHTNAELSAVYDKERGFYSAPSKFLKETKTLPQVVRENSAVRSVDGQSGEVVLTNYATKAELASATPADYETVKQNAANALSKANAAATADALTSETARAQAAEQANADAIAKKANAADLAAVATSGKYSDLTDKPTIPTVPTAVSAFQNDAGYVTESVTNGLASASDLSSLAPLSSLTSHTSDKSNPHAVTAAQVGAYTKAETDAKVANATPGDYANVSNKAYSAATKDALSAETTARQNADTANADAIAAEAERAKTAEASLASLSSLESLEKTVSTKADASALSGYATTNALETALAALAPRYAFAAPDTAAIAAADGVLYSVSAGADGVSVTLPAAADCSQDFIVRLSPADTNGTCLAAISAASAADPDWQYDYPTGTNAVFGTITAPTYFTFTQTAANRWSVFTYAATKEEE